MTSARRWLWLLLLIPLAAGVYRLRFDAEVMNLLPTDFPVVNGLKLHQTNFANARELIVTVSAAEADTTDAAARIIAQRLRAESNLVAEVVWQPLWLEKPGQSAELVAYMWLNQPQDEFAKLAERLQPANAPAVIADSREALATSMSPGDMARRAYDPLGLSDMPNTQANPFGDGSDMFVSGDGTFRLLFVKPAMDLSDYRRCNRWLAEVRGVVDSTLKESGNTASIRYTGRPAFVSEISSGMQRDMTGPSGATLLVIAILFYLVHRSIKPLAWLTVFLLAILAGTAALGGLVYGTINVISLGFASILLGLAEDFGVVLYQESRSHPGLSAREIRRIAGPGIFWSTVTVCGAFLALNFGGLPGLGQLGTLVAIGIALAAVLMLYGYLPLVIKKTNTAAVVTPVSQPDLPSRDAKLLPWVVGLIILVSGVTLFVKRPAFDNSPDALRPRQSEAYSAAEEIKSRVQRTQEPMWLVATGRDEAEILQRLRHAQSRLAEAVSNGVLTSFTLPLAFWPDPVAQSSNRPVAAQLAARGDALRQAIVAGGFTTNATALTDSILDTWRRAAAQGVFWPTNENSRWILEKFIARNNSTLLALGLVQRSTDESLAELTPRLVALSEDLAPSGVYLSGWEMLGHALFARVRADFWKILLPMALLVLISLWLAYRDWRDVALSVITLAVSGVMLWGIMALLGWKWNLLNLMAIPLLLGMGVDFSIHIQLAMRRTGGNMAEVRGSIGKALLLAGTTTVMGFASLALSNNAGLASLGKICGLGIVCAMLVSVYRLPFWWKLWHGRVREQGTGQ